MIDLTGILLPHFDRPGQIADFPDQRLGVTLLIEQRQRQVPCYRRERVLHIDGDANGADGNQNYGNHDLPATK
ncbi:MAG TPA: hypothetical protein VF194_00745 [Ferrovibrio sp.]|uniref:hypothetical protein n=1 Tax=Ferrovibrio sp. TaxID=1917215 RepID=UPI002ED58514